MTIFDSQHVDAHEAILDSGILTQSQRVVYMAVYANGPITGREINFRLSTQSGHKRLAELKRLDVIDTFGKKKCTSSGKLTVAWRVTHREPKLKKDAAPTSPRARLMQTTGRAIRLAKALRLRPGVRRKEPAEEFMGRYLKWERDHVATITDDIEEESDAE